MNVGILQAAGGLGLFLLGMIVMTDGLHRVAGSTMRRTLTRWTRDPSTGVLTGTAATALLQSSSATTVAAVGFVSAGLLTFPQALGVILGANLGTTVTGWLVAIVGFKLAIGAAASPLVLLGVTLRLAGRGRVASLGLACAGFGLLFLGIASLQEGLAGLQDVLAPETFPPDTVFGRLQLLLLGLALTIVTQSSSAGVASALVLLHTGSIEFTQAAAMVIGMDLGTTASAAVATLGGTVESKRTGYSHVVFNVLTAVGAFLLLYPYVAALELLAPSLLVGEAELVLVGFHTLFNLLSVLCMLPFTRGFAQMIFRLVPEPSSSLTRGLGSDVLVEPAVAIEPASRTVADLCRVLFATLVGRLEPRWATNGHEPEEIERALDQTTAYLARINTRSDGEGAELVVHLRHLALMHSSDHLRRMLDRCAERERIELATEDPELFELAAKLLRLARRAAGATAEVDETLLADACAFFEELGERKEPYRAGVLGRAASGEIEDLDALALLDSMRWLKRVSYHTWRILHHQHTARCGEPPTLGGAVPPHAEHEAEE